MTRPYTLKRRHNLRTILATIPKYTCDNLGALYLGEDFLGEENDAL